MMTGHSNAYCKPFTLLLRVASTGSIPLWQGRRLTAELSGSRGVFRSLGRSVCPFRANWMGLLPAGPLALLDEVLPHFDVHEVHETYVRARIDDVYAAVKQVTAREVRLLMALEVLRGLPRLLIGRRPFRPSSTAPLLESFAANVVPLGERPGAEIVAGAVGRFWRLFGNEPAVIRTRAEFLAFAERGYAKAAVAFIVLPEAEGTRLTTETRVVGTSPDATRLFRRYWLLIRPASGIIRRSWLAAIRRRAVGMR